ncbi:hypothetical protein HGM15179_005270 [Zosterops borbonicus]|uniref:Peroxiredoxin-like 2A n=2 Tax=Zosteropidae TaxID=36297 RepID=A0A8K1GQ41_9PASS|nr:hypothetical protein HGM15179_005270 [Zosterops borbonicus]
MQPKTGLAEGHQIKLICKKRGVHRESTSLFWVLNVRQEGSDSEDKEFLFHNKEASELSSLKPQLSKLGVPLYAVVKENIGTEVEDFQHYFKGEIFLDEKKGFYGPRRRKMMLSGFFRLGVWQNFFRAWRGGYTGNLEGEGFTLGGVYVIGAGTQGILLEHREKEFGDKVSLPSVLEAAEKIKPQAS